MSDENVATASAEALEIAAEAKEGAKEAAARGDRGLTKPPWEQSGEEFDPERAWNLIEKLREEGKTTKAELDKAAKKIKAAEDATKSKEQQLADDNAALESRANTAEGKALRLEVALDKAPEGMSLQQVRKLAKRLNGNTPEELEADAEELFAEFVPNGDEGKSARRPKEKLRTGAAPSSEPEETDPDKLAAMVPRQFT